MQAHLRAAKRHAIGTYGAAQQGHLPALGHTEVMAVLFDYFSAASDEQAATVIDRPGGPGRAYAALAPQDSSRRGLFRRRSSGWSGPATDTGVQFFTVFGDGIDPVVQMGTFEELLTGRAYDDIVEDPQSGRTVADRDGGERLVLTLTDRLRDALAAASPERLAELAVPWSQTEEFCGQGDPEVLATFLNSLAGLARQAQDKHERLYCWVCV